MRASPIKEIKVYKSQKPTDHIEKKPFKESLIVELVSDKKDTTESNEKADKNNRASSKGNNVNQVDEVKKNFEAQDSSKFQVEYIDTIEPVKGQIVYKTSVSSSQESEKKVEKAYSYKFTPTSKEKFKDLNENRYFTKLIH